MGKQWKQWYFIFGGSKITEDGDCSHEIKRCFASLIAKKAMTNLDSILKSRDRFSFLGTKITAGCDYSHEINRHLFLGRKAMTNLDSIFKSRDITLSTNVCLVKSMVFPVVLYRCESCTIKKAEHWRIDALELWCWRRLQGDQTNQS